VEGYLRCGKKNRGKSGIGPAVKHILWSEKHSKLPTAQIYSCQSREIFSTDLGSLLGTLWPFLGTLF
jgi:hypothetical protein